MEISLIVLLCFFLFYTLDFGLKIKKFSFAAALKGDEGDWSGGRSRVWSCWQWGGGRMWRMENHSEEIPASSPVMQTSTWAKFLINLFAAEKEVVLPRVDVSHFSSLIFFYLRKLPRSFKWYFHLSRKEISLRKTFTTFPAIQLKIFITLLILSPTDCKCKIEAQRLNHNKFCKRDYGEFLHSRGWSSRLREIGEQFFQLFLIRWMAWLTVENENSSTGKPHSASNKRKKMRNFFKYSRLLLNHVVALVFLFNPI